MLFPSLSSYFSLVPKSHPHPASVVPSFLLKKGADMGFTFVVWSKLDSFKSSPKISPHVLPLPKCTDKFTAI
jgi:hypothetical protein